MKTPVSLAAAFNSARRFTRALIGVAVNTADAAPITEEKDGWLKLAPYGETVYWHEDGQEWKKLTQSFQKPQADAMVVAFNSLSVKKGANFKGLPIFSGHPDIKPDRWPDERRLGGVMGLDARADGLYVKVAWNSLGLENQKEGFLVYPSPAWDYDHAKVAQTGRIEPDELRSVGLTNTPRIQDSIPWVNSDDPNAPDPDAAPTSQSQSASNSPAKMNYKKMLAQHLGVPETASDEDLQKAHDTVMGAKKDKEAADAKAVSDKAAADQKVKDMQATVGNAESARDRALNDAEKYRKLAAGTLIDTAINAGRITAAEKPAFETAFNTDFDAGKAKLDEKKTALNTTTLGLRPAAVGVDLANPESRRLAFNARVDHLMRENEGKGKKRYGIDEALRDMRANPDDRALLDAMQPPKQTAAKAA